MAITFQIIGHKKSGKTLVTTKLIQQLTSRGYRVAAIKHDAHKAAMDISHTDSARMSDAGAQQVILQSNNDFFFHQHGNLPPLTKFVNFLAIDNDFVLIEGHKGCQDYPKLLLLNPGETPAEFNCSPLICQIGTIFNNPLAKLHGITDIVEWCQKYLEEQL
ncbi:molybdopterin-guanine dinucleotide biosynthesis protein B [Limosilactobacillus sp. STM2_1]|uniref:Molybdopterin-guanine dinucleotide biosynthesis protein B n=1 Tax=Limosilactobacillus rudii TaxID=2759755 RepID=A0A7W3YNZ8_9LACO|nr:molybdopterin-guanine dinucleotide biosynthesis protein B [Limosilactobacillus rudii]MBB1078889.1 molybdopterin-guanine dinucleotide biosynthesis protein B [Limosilactobacillus rudii]MBB1098235.1 molybdopterin-guanine dinucleotide biosynthesis protein B [Limosilactobacillus rudii]MCD7135650.1 molybdopterin-guanine dinucleotide biosynthesis protein B [Limosilactobacillus rudii]